MLHFAALWLLVRVVGRLPARLLYAAADAAGTVAWHASPRLRRTTRDHMRHVLLHGSAVGDPAAVDRAARGCVRSAARYYADFARAPHLSPEQAFAEAEIFEGLAHFFDAHDRGCGVILCSAHLGSPEYIFRSASFLGLEMAVLTEVLSPPRLHDFVHRVRGAPGVRFLPANRSGLRETLTQLRGGGVVAVLGDRDIQGAGRPVPFFGERAALPSGPVELALRTNAALVPTFGTRSGVGRYRITFQPGLELQRSDDREADIEAGMRALARALERGISAAPDQWFALHPVWRGLPRAASSGRTIAPMAYDDPDDQNAGR